MHKVPVTIGETESSVGKRFAHNTHRCVVEGLPEPQPPTPTDAPPNAPFFLQLHREGLSHLADGRTEPQGHLGPGTEGGAAGPLPGS